jgi:hypothetical protein
MFTAETAIGALVVARVSTPLVPADPKQSSRSDPGVVDHVRCDTTTGARVRLAALLRALAVPLVWLGIVKVPVSPRTETAVLPSNARFAVNGESALVRSNRQPGGLPSRSQVPSRRTLSPSRR